MKCKKIPVAAPVFKGKEKEYVNDCLDTTWVSSIGKYIGLFEEKFAEYCGVEHGVACCNGTVALHLALDALGIGSGDEVIVPSLTFVATANAVTYCGAKPIFADSESKKWNLDPDKLEALITPKTKAIIVVHLYGQPADMDKINIIAKKNNLFVIEDAAEAHGSLYKGKKVGSLGDVSVFSFFGNKIITCGEGGMVLTNNKFLADKIRLLRGQGMDPQKRYWFIERGYNYRMTNIAAAIGLAQLEQIDQFLERRKQIAKFYRDKLKDISCIFFQEECLETFHANWMFTICLNESFAISRDELMKKLMAKGIETRPVFYPMNILPIYEQNYGEGLCPVAEKIASIGLNLPTWFGLSDENLEYICQSIKEILK